MTKLTENFLHTVLINTFERLKRGWPSVFVRQMILEKHLFCMKQHLITQISSALVVLWVVC